MKESGIGPDSFYNWIMFNPPGFLWSLQNRHTLFSPQWPQIPYKTTCHKENPVTMSLVDMTAYRL